jgi:hypothetical protein
MSEAVRIVTPSGTGHPSLLSLELRRALLEAGDEPLAGVAALEEPLLHLVLQGE